MMGSPVEQRDLALQAVRVRERAINHLLGRMFGEPAAHHDDEHETMAAYIDALLEDPVILRDLADTFAPREEAA